MTIKNNKTIYVKIIPIFLCLNLFGCGDFSCKDMSSSSLRRYGAPERIEKINKEISSLEKGTKDEKTTERLGDLHEQLATIYLDQEEYDSSLTHINKAFYYKRNTPYLNYLAGLIYGNFATKSGSKDDAAKAEQYYKKAIELKNDYTEALHALAMLLFFSKKERQEPIKIVEGLYEKNPSNYRVRFTLGRFYYESGRKQDALDVYNALRVDLQKAPDSPIIQEFLNNCINNIKKIKGELGSGE
jgi:tetratricopeptide (TPR) repeat protein